MEFGMLWFDNDPKLNLCDKVQKAAAYYQSKYPQTPNLCFVHPSMLPDEKSQAGEIMVRANTTIRPHHFWMGFQQEGEFDSRLESETSGS
jgi:hypothetical protein